MRLDYISLLDENSIMVQIGTNDGMDDFQKMVRRVSPKVVLLVEPNGALNGKIQSNYHGVENYTIENYAIVKEENAGEVILVIPRNNPNTGKARNGFSYGDKGYSLVPMDDWGDDFERLCCKSITLNGLCAKHGIDCIDFLHIDTEGYDAEIIKSIDFDRLRVKIIKYEYWGFGSNSFKRHGNNSGMYGKMGMDWVWNYLGEKGYEINRETDSEGCANMIAIQKNP